MRNGHFDELDAAAAGPPADVQAGIRQVVHHTLQLLGSAQQ